MSYTNATFFVDYESGVDTARTALTSVTVANPSGSITRATKVAHGLVTGAVVDLTLFSSWLNAAWKITVVDADNFDLDGAVWQTTADNNGTATPRGGSSMADAWKTVTSGVTAARHAPGDTIRVKASPNPTSLGINGTWTDGPQQATKAIVSSTNATPIVITLSSGNYTTLAPAVGDTVIINGHTTNTNANGVWTISAVNGSTTITLQDAAGNNSVGNGVGGASGTVRKATNMVVTLASALTKNIALFGNQGQKPNWTASANVTTTVITTSFKEGGECQKIDVGASFTTGLAAYFATGTLDLSAYQQVSFWIMQTAGTLGAASSLSLKLCSDAAGATPVNTVNLPALGALNQWSQINVDLAGALGSSIASVALYVNTDNGAQTFQLDNIFACKASSSADSLNLSSLISKNTGSEAWFGIQSINGTRVILDAATSTIPAGSPQRGYSGTTETVTTYKRETVKTLMAASASSHVQSIQVAGTAGNLISYSGGWNRTDMTTQTGETWWDGQNGLGYGLSDANAARPYISVDKINFTRYYTGYYQNSGGSNYQVIGSIAANNCTFNPIICFGSFIAATTLSAVQNGYTLSTGPAGTTTTIARADGCIGGDGVTLGRGSNTTTVTQANNNSQNGVMSGSGGYVGTVSAAHGNGNAGYAYSDNSVCGTVTANANKFYGLFNQGVPALILGGSTSGNATAGVVNGFGTVTLRNFTASDSTPFSVNNTFGNVLICSERNGGVADAHLITTDGGTIISATDQRHTASGIAWKFRPTSTNRSSFYPLPLSVAKIACTANLAVTVKIWTRRDNTNIQGRLRLPGGQLAGVPSDVIVACAPTINTWVQSSALTFTPTENGVVEVFFECWDGVGTSNNMWIDDLSVA